MKLLKNIAMGIWMYWDLRHIRKYQKKIHRYRAEGNVEKEKENIRLAESTWGANLIRKTGTKVIVEGRENIPKKGPVVIVSNHQSNCDIPVLTYVLSSMQFGFIAKEGLAKLPLFGRWIYDVRSVFIKRNDPREALKVMDEGISYLKQGFSLGVFPEGTRSQGPEMGEFKKGALRLATKPKMPILPITISGTYRCMEEKGCICPATVRVFIHPVMELKDMEKSELNSVPDRVEAQIKEKLRQLQEQEKEEMENNR